MSAEANPDDDISIEVTTEDDETTIEFPEEKLTTPCKVTKVGSGLYRLDTVPMLSELANFGDVIEADEIGEKRLRFKRVAQAGGWKLHSFIFPRGKLDGDRGKSLVQRLEDKGVYWERVLGGLLVICVPPDLDFDPTPWIDAF